MSKRIFLFAVAFSILIFLLVINLRRSEESVVVRVIDGDTFVLDNGEKVRLLGINAPEKGQRCYDEATNALKDLVEGKKVRLEKDKVDRDVYGRLLRYVFVDNTFVNAELLRQGYAFPYFNDVYRYRKELEEAAKVRKGCIWQRSKLSCRDCIGIEYFHYNAKGNDCVNLNDEYVKLRNTCNFTCNLTNWIIKDEANHIFKFPEFLLKPYERVVIYTGCGNNTAKALYWCNCCYACNAIWDNDHDTLYLFDDKGYLVLSYSY